MRLQCLVFALLLPAMSRAHTQAVTPPALPARASDAAPLAPAYTLRAGTQIVVVDVVVKDKQGAKVHSLRATDFSITENGKLQPLRSFEEHTAPAPAQAATMPTPPQLPPGEFTNYVSVPQGREANGTQPVALNIILYDTTNTSPTGQAYMHAQLLDYLKHARPEISTAIFALGTHLVQVQGFTSNPATLLAALTRKNPEPSPFRDDLSGGLTASQSTTAAGAALASAAGGFPTGIAALEGPITAYQNDQRTYITLDGLNTLGRYLVTLPGRKNLIWFAGDFPPSLFPTEDNFNGPYPDSAVFDAEYRDTVNLLSRAQVAVYPIDAQGLRTDQSNSASRSNAGFADGSRGLARSGQPEAVAHQAEFNNTSQEHAAMNQIAQDTGGEAFYNHNDLSRMVTDAIVDGSSYYTLTYVPAAGSERDGYRSIHVRVEGDAYSLSYRRGYFIDRSKRAISTATATAATAPSPASSITQALRPGAPQPSQILIRAKAFPVSAPDQAEIFQGNDPNPSTKIMHPPYRVYEVDTAASALEMSFAHGSDDVYRTTVDFVTYVYDLKGTLINSQSNTMRVAFRKEGFAQAVRGGVHFNQRISVPAQGQYFLRTAVHDTTSGHLGALEIPVAAIAGLTAPAALSPTPSSTASTPADPR